MNSTGSPEQSISTYRPTREPWGRTLEAGYDTAPTSVAIPTPKDDSRGGLLEGISSANQQFHGSSANWHPSRSHSCPASRGTVDLTHDKDQGSINTHTLYQSSYSVNSPIDPPNFFAQYAGAEPEGDGGDNDKDNDQPRRN